MSQLLSLNKPLKYGLCPKQPYTPYFMQESRDLCWESCLAFCSTQFSSRGHTHPKPEVFTKSPLKLERQNQMFWDLGPQYMCTWADVFVSLVAPHLKDDYLHKYQNINIKHLRPRVSFLLAPNFMACVPPPLPFKGKPHLFKNASFKIEFDKLR